jgi:acyl-CoA thioester hydrolase
MARLLSKVRGGTSHRRNVRAGRRAYHVAHDLLEPSMYRPIETYRGMVYPWQIDHVGHMNVQFYTARFDEASWQLLGRLGVSPAVLREEGRAAVAADQRTQYRREVFAGTLLHVTTELLEVGRRSLRFVHRMFDSATDEEVATTELVGVYFDVLRRVSLELPPSVRARAESLRAEPHGRAAKLA